MPGVIAAKLGDPLLILGAWVAGGLLTFLGANIYAELGTTYPKAGGPYVYVREAAGPFAGFVTGWSDSAVNIIASAAQASAIGVFLENDVLDHRLIAVAVLALLMMVNWYGLKVGARTQQGLSLVKVGALALLALACLAIGGFKVPSDPQYAQNSVSLAAWSGAVMLVSETYAGWNSSVYFSEEDMDSDRNVPRALFWGIGAMMAAYLLVNAGFLSIMPIADLATSTLPAADAAQRIFGSESGMIVKVLAVVSLIGIVNVGVMFAPRITFAMSRDGVLPEGFQAINRFGTPSWGLIAFTLPSMALVMLKSFDFLFTVTAFLGMAINSAVYVAFFALRRNEPDIRRPYVARWYPWAPALVVLISIMLLGSSLITDPEPALWAISAIALSWPFYRGMVSMRK
jgi:APA family basic amino acid/polyamine antiporter